MRTELCDCRVVTVGSTVSLAMAHFVGPPGMLGLV
jgi:hypothetical protein